MERRPTSSSPPPLPASKAAQVRARHPQALLSLTASTTPGSYPYVLARLRPETRVELEVAAETAWLPMAIDIEVVEAVAAQLGPSDTALLVAARQREEMGSALFDGFVQTALRVFGASPVNMVKRLPAGWGHLFRNAGWIEIVSTDRTTAVTRFHRLPYECTSSAAWMAALPVGLRTLYEIVGVRGTVDCRVEDAGLQTLLVTFRWR